MAKKNIYGKKAECKNCGNIWLTKSKNEVTSCSKCRWRVRIIPLEEKLQTEKVILTEEEIKRQKEVEENEKRILWEKKREQKEILKEERRKYKQNLKYRCFSHYSGGPPKCSYPGCIVDDIEVLTLDHINGGGNNERKIYGGSVGIYRYLIDMDFPEGYRVLCFNHNYKEALIKGFIGNNRRKQH